MKDTKSSTLTASTEALSKHAFRESTLYVLASFASHEIRCSLRALFQATGELLDHYPAEALDPSCLPVVSVLSDEFLATLAL